MGDQERVLGLLGRQAYMVIAVVLDNATPWTVPVRIKKQVENTFEWESRLDTVHSIAIENNPSMAVTIFEIRDDTQTGLYMSGKGELVTSEGEYGLYRFNADLVWLNDETFTKREIVLS